MKAFIAVLLLLCLAGNTLAQEYEEYKQDFSIVIAPLSFDKHTNYGLMYRRNLKEKWEWRAGLDLNINAVQEIRADTQLLAEGALAFRNSLGIQRNLENGKSIPPKLVYIGMDLFWNSLMKKKPEDLYYYYYSNFGLMPLIGLNYSIDRFRFLFECRANFNMNFQSYSGTGSNYTRAFNFRTIDNLALGLGYRF